MERKCAGYLYFGWQIIFQLQDKRTSSNIEVLINYAESLRKYISKLEDELQISRFALIFPLEAIHKGPPKKLDFRPLSSGCAGRPELSTQIIKFRRKNSLTWHGSTRWHFLNKILEFSTPPLAAHLLGVLRFAYYWWQWTS